MKAKHLKTLSSIALCAALLSVSVQTAAITLPSDENDTAQALYEVGILRGDGVNFKLDEIPDRLQASVMVVRMRGEEAMAKAAYASGEITNPFSDVTEEWAKPYVSWLYDKGITMGIGDGKFGNSDCTPEMYATFMLRALGYRDTGDNIDFTYADSVAYAKEKQLYTDAMDGDTFDRSTMAGMTYLTLAADVVGTGQSLLRSLVDRGAIDAGAASDLFTAYGETAPLPQVDLGGGTLTILEEADVSFTPRTFVGKDGEGSDLIDDALLARRIRTEDLCNMVIESVVYETETYRRNLLNAVMAAEPMYDLTLGSVTIGTYFAAIGVLRDLASVDGLNLNNSWWDASLNRGLSIGGMQFMASGDLLLPDDRALSVLYYAPDHVKALIGEDPADAVRDGRWTLDMLYTIAKAASEHERKPDSIQTDDRLVQKLYVGAGGHVIGRDEQDYLTIDVDLQHTAAVLDSYSEIPGIRWNTETGYDFAAQGLSEGGTVLVCDTLANIGRYVVPSGGISVLPMPKYDGEQADYRCMADLDAMRVLSLPQTHKYDEIGTVLEILASESGNLADAFRVKYTEANKTGMLDLILDCGVVDLTSADSHIEDVMKNLTANPYSVSTIFAQYEKVLDKSLEKFNSMVKQLWT
ncbi:MAG: S-layer homology domain-containing protein [Clostridia bacterium]|nr:S-layer homology domain-containing protein [Clostridia bacterium]